MRLVIGNGAAKAIDDGLASLIARAIATRNMFLAGQLLIRQGLDW